MLSDGSPSNFPPPSHSRTDWEYPEGRMSRCSMLSCSRIPYKIMQQILYNIILILVLASVIDQIGTVFRRDFQPYTRRESLFGRFQGRNPGNFWLPTPFLPIRRSGYFNPKHQTARLSVKSLSIFSAVISSPFSLTIVSRTDSFIILWYFSIFSCSFLCS